MINIKAKKKIGLFIVAILAACSLTGGISANASPKGVQTPKLVISGLKLSYKFGSTVSFKVKSNNYTRKVKYDVSLYNIDTKKNMDLTKGYTKSIGGSQYLNFSAVLKSAGRYRLRIYVKALADKSGSSNYSDELFTVEADTRAMTSAINKAAAVLNSKTIGTRIGNVSEAAKNNFQAVIEKARLQANNTKSGQKQIDVMTFALNKAIADFNNSAVKPANKAELLAIIASAQSKAMSTKVGDDILKPGQISRMDKYALINAITEATKVVIDPNVTADDAAKAEDTLRMAMEEFASKIQGPEQSAIA